MATNIQQMSCATEPQEVNEAIEDMMKFHQWNEEQKADGAPIRQAAKDLVFAIIVIAPPSADRSAAIRHVREALYSANGAITHNGKF